MAEAQAALEEVKIIIPDGMSVKNHGEELIQTKESQGQEVNAENSDQIIKSIQETEEQTQLEHELGVDKETLDQQNDVQQQSQNAMEYIQTKDPFSGKKEATPKPMKVVKEQPVVIEEVQEEEKPKKVEAPKPLALIQAQAAISYVEHTAVKENKVEVKKGLDPIMPTTFQKNGKDSKEPESDLEKSI